MTGISEVCFAASYAVALALEVSRYFFRAKIRTLVMTGFAIAGIVAHSIFLTSEAREGVAGGAPLSSWYHGCLFVAWILALAYLGSGFWNVKSAPGLLLLPTALALVAAAHVFPKEPSLSSDQARQLWTRIHGYSLLLGTVSVLVGLFAGLIYLVHSYRLKRGKLGSAGIRLPSLEWLQRVNERSLLVSCVLLAVGLVSGVLMNWIRSKGESNSIPWSDPVVWTSLVLLIWMIATFIFNLVYRPARAGHKVAYLTVANSVFLGLVLVFLFLVPSKHLKQSEAATSEVDAICAATLSQTDEVAQ